MNEKATLAGGCFWCLEAVYQQLKGVTHVESGYTGGQTVNPDYDAVCTGKTGHAEVVQITYDPTVISYQQLLEIFFTIHDPTSLNRQGHDIGTQYRSAIFVHDEAQWSIAKQVIEDLSAQQLFSQPIVTQVERLGVYYKAEQEHQNYFVDHPWQGYCAFVIEPKVQKFRAKFSSWLKPTDSH